MSIHMIQKVLCVILATLLLMMEATSIIVLLVNLNTAKLVDHKCVSELRHLNKSFMLQLKVHLVLQEKLLNSLVLKEKQDSNEMPKSNRSHLEFINNPLNINNK